MRVVDDCRLMTPFKLNFAEISIARLPINQSVPSALVAYIIAYMFSGLFQGSGASVGSAIYRAKVCSIAKALHMKF